MSRLDNSATPERAHTSARRRLTHMEAVIEGIRQEMLSDESVFFVGQDAGPFGGAMQGTKGLWEQFGASRILESPISESAMVGLGVGAALLGRRPIVEVSFGEFLPAAMNQLINQAPNIHYMTGGALRVPLVVRTRVGDGPYGGHPQDYSAWFTHVPGLKVGMPATPADALGLMRAAIRDDNPVLFFEPMSLSHGRRGNVDSIDATLEFGKARVAREGSDVTLVVCGSALPLALQAGETLSERNVDVEIIDLRTLAPWDEATVVASVSKTHRLVTAHEAWIGHGFGAEVVARVVQATKGAFALRAARVGALPVPIPSGPLRQRALPDVEQIVAAVEDTCAPAQTTGGVQ